MRKRKKIYLSLVFFVLLYYILLYFPSITLVWSQSRKEAEIARFLPGDLEGEEAELNFRVRAFSDYIISETSITVTDIDWDIHKPNVYATEAIEMLLFWEGPIQISFEGAEKLTSDNEQAAPIEVWYAVIEQESAEGTDIYRESSIIEGEEDILKITDNHSLSWLSPEELNNFSVSFSPNHHIFTFRRLNIWMKLRVGIGTRVGNYMDKDGFFVNVTARP